MELQPIAPRIRRTLASLGLGIILVCGLLLLFGNVIQPVSAAPILPRHNSLPLASQATIPVTTTIQAAINAASPGDIVEFTGTYTENVVINKSLTLQGSSSAATLVYNGVFPFPTAPSILVAANNVTVTNMTLLGVGFVQHSAVRIDNSSNVQVTNVSVQSYPTGIQVRRTIAGPTGITITNNLIQEPGGGAIGNGGIYFLGSGAGVGAIQATVQSNQISGYSVWPLIQANGLAPSLIASNVLTAGGANAEGTIYLDQSGLSVVRNNQLIGPTAPLIGIRLTGTANPTVTQNTIDSLFDFGIQVDGSATPNIFNSNISGHSTFGIHILDYAQPRVVSNTLANNLLAINIEDDAQPQILTNAIINNNAGFGGGIQVSDAATPTIIQNRIVNNPAGLIYNSSGPLTAGGNTICRNSSVGLSNGSGFTQTVSGNWWGHNPPLNAGGFSDYSGSVISSPISMVLTLNPSPALIPLNGTVGVTLTMSGGGYNVLDGTGINFSATAGNLSVANTATLNGLANTVYTGTVLGAHTITATDDCGGVVTATIIVGEPVLTTTKTADPPSGSLVRPGAPITYTVYVTNTGAYTASGVVFSDTMPTFTTLAATAIDAGIINSSNPVSATFNPIPPNNGVMSVTMRVTVTLPLTNGLILTNTGSISYFNGTANVISSTNPVTHQITSSPDITLTKTAQPPHGSNVRPGDYITYTLTLTNQGDANATGVVVSDTIPANTFLVSLDAAPNVMTTAGNPLRGDIAFLPAPNGTAQITFTVRVTSPLANNTLITNTAQVTSNETSSVITYSNTVTHRVQSAAVLTITKMAQPPHGSVVSPADPITYTLIITNTGDDNAYGVVITDVTPPEVNYVGGSATAVNGTITNLPPALRVTAPVLTGTLLDGTQSSIRVTFVVTVTTPMTSGTLIANTGYVTFTGSPVVTPSNVVTHVVQSSPQLTLTKRAEPPSGSYVSPGQRITYTLSITNEGNANATGVVVSDTLPQYTNYVNGSASAGASLAQAGNLITVDTPFLAGEGGVLTVSVVVTVTTPLTDGLILTNRAWVTSTEIATLTYANEVTHEVESTPQLTITKEAEPIGGSVVSPGDLITYTLRVSNTGNANALGVVVSDTVPAHTTLVFSAATGGVVLSGPDPLRGDIGVLAAPGGVEVITLTVQVANPLTDSTIIANTAWVTATGVPTITYSEEVTHLVRSSPVLTMVKSAVPVSPGPVRPGDTITYTLVVRNIGNANATGVVISDTFPAHTGYALGSSSLAYGGGAGGFATMLPGGQITFWGGNIPAPNGVVTATFAVMVTRPLTNGLIITNTAWVTSTEVATITYSNVVTHQVESAPVITISKEANPPHGSTVSPGQAITYTLRITNTGDAIAQNVVVTDTVPGYTNYVNGSAGVGSISESGGVVTWNVGALTVDLPVNASFVVTLTTPLTNGLIIQNMGYVSHTGTTVVTPSNTVTHLVTSSPNVTYTKIAQPPAGSTINLGLASPSQITYTIFVTNTGNANATGLIITDTVPANTSGGGLTPWAVGTLAGNGGGASNSFVVTVNMPLPDMTVITNTYEVSYNELPGVFTSSSPISPTNIVTHLIRSATAVSVTKTSVPTPTSVVTPGQVIIYNFAITNSGTATATNFVLTDTIPANTTYVAGSASASAGASVDDTGGAVITLTVSNLITPNNVITMSFRATVNSPLPDGTIISNSGWYTFDQSAALSQTNIVTHLVSSSPNITLTKTAAPPHGSPVTPGDYITYTIALTNNGTANATSAVLTDAVPLYTQYVLGSAVPAPVSTSPLVWNLGTISGGGGSAGVTFAVQVDQPLTNSLIISNSAWLDIAETTGLSQTNVVTHLVQSSTDITFTKSANPPSGNVVAPGDTITYTLVAANTGAQMATGVALTDTLPADVNVVNYAGSKGVPVVMGNLFTWNIGTLTANETVTATISVTVTTPLTSGTILSNQGELLTAQTGLSTTNFVTHTVISTPTLTLSKLATPPHGSIVGPTETITYTLIVTNSGNGPATSFQITDTVPLSTNLVGGVSATPGFAVATATNVITVAGTLNVGQTVTATFATAISPTAVSDGDILSNIGYVSYTESPVITQTNQVTHLIRMSVALTLTKFAEPSGPTIGAGDMITYTVVVSNNDIFDATNVVITEAIPANTNYVAGSFTNAYGITATGPNPLVAWVGPLTASRSVSFSFRVTVNTPITNGTIISNVAQMTADYMSLTPSNEVTHTVVSTPNLVVSKSALPTAPEVNPGDPIVYSIWITNTGDSPALNVVITDTQPISTEYFLAQFVPPITGSTVSAGPPVVATIPSLPGNGGTARLLFLTAVTDTAPAGLVITNVTQISSDLTALTTTNVVTHIVGGTSALTITKTAEPIAGTGLLPGSAITYTVRVTNSGSTTLTNLILVDLLDPNTDFISGSAAPPPMFLADWIAMWPLLAPGNSLSLVIRANVTTSVAAGIVITNVATIASAETPMIATGPVTHVIVSPNVVITKTDNVTIVQPGDLLTYTVTVSNNGTAPATNVVVTDTLPANTNYVAGSASGGGVYNPAARQIVWAIGVLTHGLQLTRTFAVTVDNPIAAGVSSITNTVTVADDSGASATADDVDVVNAAPNVVISKAPSGVVEPGQVITYTIIYTNTGNQTAAGVQITDTVPLSTTFNAGVSSPGWSCLDGDPPGTLCAYNVGVLTGSNTTGSVTFAVTVTSPLSDGTIITNVAYVSHDAIITPSNTVTHVVQLIPVLTLAKAADPPSGSTVTPADPITYTLTLTNTGTGDATGVVITDVLDPNVNLVSVTPGGAVSSTNPLVLNVGTVPAGGGVVTYTVRVTVTTPLTNGLVLANQAQVAFGGATTVTLSNQVTHTVASTPNLVIQKSSPTTTTVDPGDAINYSVRVQNTGNAPVTNLVITDVIPISTTLFGVPGISPIGAGTVTSLNPVAVTIPLLNGGGDVVTLTFSVDVAGTAPAGLVISNTAQVVSDQTVLTNSNTITHVVREYATLMFDKSADPPSGSLVSPNEMITYTLTVLNVGTTTADNLTLTDFLPAGVGFVPGSESATPGFTILSTVPTLVVSGTLSSGGMMTTTFQVTVSTAVSGTLLTNTARVTAAATLPLTRTTVHTVYAPIYSLAIAKDAAPPAGSVVEPGDFITYTLVVTNTGDAVTGVVISDTLDANVTLVASNTTHGAVTGLSPVQVSGFGLAAGERVTVTLGVTVANAVSGTIIYNQASVTSTQSTLFSSGVVTHVISNTLPVPSLAITKTAMPPSGSSVGPNTAITYTITVANNGTGDANNVMITDTLPVEVNLVNAFLSNGGTVGSSNPLTASVGTLTATNRVTLTIVVTTSAVVTDTVITNTAQTAAIGLAVEYSLPVTHIITTTPVAPLPSLAITKTAMPPSGSFVEPGDYITYTVIAVNTGGPATNVVISDTLDLVNVTLVSSGTTTGALSGPNPLQLTGFDLNTGQGVTITMVVSVTGVVSGTVINNQASVASTEVITPQLSGTVTHTISSTILAPSLAITKTAIPASGSIVEPGDFITYTITVQNNGTGPATGVVVSDTIDPNVSLVMSSTITGTLSGPNPVRVTGFNLNPGQNNIITLRVQVTGTVSGTVISNQASVTSTETPLPLNSGIVTHIISNSVSLPPNFTITKSADPPGGTTVTQNDLITYTIVVVNNGGTATGVVLTDVIPANTAYVAGSLTSTLGTPIPPGAQVTVNVPIFAGSGTTMTTTFQVRVTTNLTTTITNTATLDSDQTAPQNSNPVTHPVQGVPPLTGGVYLPIVFQTLVGEYAILEWDGGETVCDKVSDVDGGAGLALDGRTDGVFWLNVNVGSGGPRTVSEVRLTSSQPGIEWDTVVGGGPLLGIFSGGSPLNDSGNGTISGVIFSPGVVRVQLWASNDLGRTRFVPNQYIYTAVVNFSDGTSLSGQTQVWGTRPPWCP
ncbi:MAG: DUF11 domain-containing protein [Anaerolineae bacterium]|nr:DUF11 domain-containing protein [Anaerolineae bacterium]